MLVRFFLIILACIVPSVVFGDQLLFTGEEINALKVLKAEYGSLASNDGDKTEHAIWRNINVPRSLKEYWHENSGKVYVAFEARYTENNTEKYILLTQTRPLDAAENRYECHGCAPLIGGFVFTKSGDHWVLENQNKYIDVIGKWGWINRETIDSVHKDTVELISVGANKHGLIIRGDDMHQGWESSYYDLIVPFQDKLEVSLTDRIEGAGVGACEDPAARAKQGIHLTFDQIGKSEYYKLTVTKRWNPGSCGKVKSVEETKIYVLNNGKYRENKKIDKPSSAALSPDGNLRAFVRSTPDVLVETALGKEEATEIWTVRRDGGDARVRLRGHSGAAPQNTLAGLSDLQFSPDGRKIFFRSVAWVTSGAIHVLDLESGTERYICPGNSLEVIQRGEYAGCLMVSQHRYFLGGGSYEWLWLITPEGKDVGPISMEGDDESVQTFRELYIEQNQTEPKHPADRS